MASIWFRLRAEAHRSWRSWVALALLAGVFGGFAIGAIAGARRTATAYPRLVRSHEAFDAFIGGGGERDYEQRLQAIRDLPMVAEPADIVMLGFQVRLPAVRARSEQLIGFPNAIVVVDPEGHALVDVNKAKVLKGRLPDPDAVDEAVVPFTVAERYDVRVGDRIEAEIGFEGGDFARLRVVGVTASPGDFEAVGQQTLTFIWVTPALFERYRDVIGPPTGDFWNMAVRLERGAEDIEAFREIAAGELGFDVPTSEATITAGVQKSMRLYAAALWVLGGLVGVATIAIFGQSVIRHAHLAARDNPALRALGFSARGLGLITLVRSTVIGLIAAIVAGLVAYACSPFFPLGVARIAEPDPGFAFDAVGVLLGAFGLLVLLVLLSLPAAWRAARPGVAGNEMRPASPRRSKVAAALARVVASPSLNAGLRMAFEPGRGTTAVPIRSTVTAITGGVAALVLALVIGSSLSHLAASPPLAGFTYDAIVPGGDGRADDAERAAALQEVPGIAEAGRGTAANVRFAGSDSFLIAYEPGPIGFAVIDGHAPGDRFHLTDGGARLPEIALGPATMRRMGTGIGDVVTFDYETGEGALAQQQAVIVGSIAIPALPWMVVDPGEGAGMSLHALETFFRDEGTCCFVTFEPDADQGSIAAELRQRGLGVAFFRGSRADLSTLERLAGLPAALTAIFAAMAAAAFAHVLLSAIRRRRHDLAILKTLGFVRRQVAATIAWQSTAIALVCIAVGVPFGIGLGRWSWKLIASSFGVVPEAVLPTMPIVGAAAGCLVLSNVLALVPARLAARTSPASVLRAE